MTTQTETQSTDADSDDDYLDDVVVRAALERVQRDLSDREDVRTVNCDRFNEIAATKTDYITIHLESHTVGNGFRLGKIVQSIADTGVVRIDEINVDREEIRVAPTEQH